MTDVVIRFKETPPVELEIDLSKLTWRDIFDLQRLGAEGGQEEEDRVVQIVQKCVPDVDVMTLPATTLEPVMRAILGRVRRVEEDQKN